MVLQTKENEVISSSSESAFIFQKKVEVVYLGCNLGLGFSIRRNSINNHSVHEQRNLYCSGRNYQVVLFSEWSYFLSGLIS